MSRTAKRRAAGIIRVSEKKKRKGRSFVSPREQRERIEAECERERLDLRWCEKEIDVKGKTPLAKRVHLLEAVEAIEAGELDVIVVAYFDRLVRAIAIQAEILSRVEAAGGQIFAVGFGEITEKTAHGWLSATIIGAMNEFAVRQGAERSAEAQQDAIDHGVPPFPNIPPGLRRVDVPTGHDDHGKIEPDPETAPFVVEAFRLRAEGATVKAVREYLRENGIERSYHGVGSMLESRLYLGEIHFGDYEPNLAAFVPPVITPDLWRRVQSIQVPRGRRAKSERLLARLKVLRCASCGGRMVVGSSNNSKYHIYRCPSKGDCGQRVTISAEIAEDAVVSAVREALADAEGRASVEDNSRQAESDAETAQANLDAAIRAFTGLEGEQSATDKLAELQTARDEAVERVNQLGGNRASVTVNASDWDSFPLDTRRALIRATVDRAEVRPGRGKDRVTVHLVG